MNHIHADDLVHIIIRTLFRGRPQRIYNVADDQPILMGDYFDKIADAKQLARPERVSKLELPTRISTSLLGFMSASRKVSNQRMKEELGITLRYPCIDLTCSTTMDAAKDPVLRIQK